MAGDDCQMAYCQAELYVEYMTFARRAGGRAEDAGRLCRQPDHGRGDPPRAGHLAGGVRARLPGLLKKLGGRLCRCSRSCPRRVSRNWRRPSAGGPGRRRRRPAGLRLSLPRGGEGGAGDGPEGAGDRAEGIRWRLTSLARLRVDGRRGRSEAMAALEACLDRKGPSPLVLQTCWPR